MIWILQHTPSRVLGGHFDFVLPQDDPALSWWDPEITAWDWAKPHSPTSKGRDEVQSFDCIKKKQKKTHLPTHLTSSHRTEDHARTSSGNFRGIHHRNTSSFRSIHHRRTIFEWVHQPPLLQPHLHRVQWSRRDRCMGWPSLTVLEPRQMQDTG